jgi:L-lactate utilization protein LutC
LISDIIAEFIHNAQHAGSQALFVTTRANLSGALLEAVSGDAAVFCPAITELEKSISISESIRTMDYRNAAVVVEEALAGVAETGTIVVRDSHDKPIQASMLCEHYVAILNCEQIFDTFENLFASFGHLPPHLSLITGPSRTADIEKTLVMGMHGPARVSIMIVCLAVGKA